MTASTYPRRTGFWLGAALGALTLCSSASADTARFEYAFLETCFVAIPDLRDTPSAFNAPEWQGVKGADDGEFEFYADSTMVFLNAVAPDDGPGCTVMDSQVSKSDAEALLQATLVEHYPNLWAKGVGYNDQPVWRFYKDNTKTEFYINDGMDGGVGISLQVHK